MPNSVYGRIKESMGQTKQPPPSSRGAPIDPQLKQLTMELQSTLIEQVGLLQSPDRETLIALRNEALALAQQGDLAGTQAKVADLKKRLDAIQKAGASTPQPATPDQPVTPVPQPNQPDADALKQLVVELQSTLLEEVGQLKSPHREVLVPLRNQALALAQKGDLPGAQAKVTELKKGLDEVRANATALKNIVTELQTSLADEIAQLPNPYRKDLSTLQREAAALAAAQDLQGTQAKVAELKKGIVAAKAKLKEFDDLGDDPEAQKKWGVEEAKKAYAAQMKSEVSEKYNKDGKFNMKNLQEDQEIGLIFNSPRAQAFIQQHGLTEGEAKAVITYTAVNYKYINPATANQKDKPADFDQETKKYKPEQIDLYKIVEAKKAKGDDVRDMEKDLDTYKKKGWLDADNRLNFNNVDKADRAAFAEAVKKYSRKDWMDAQNRPDPSKAKNAVEKRQLEDDLKKYEEGQKASLYEEGALHAGMIMEAFKKLPKYSGPLFRGRRMSPGAFASQFPVGKKVPFESLSSFSKNRSKAQTFANHGDPNNPPPADATISVLLVATLPDAADIEALSLYPAEEECLIPPGTELEVTLHTDTPKGGAPVDRCVTVTLAIPGV